MAQSPSPRLLGLVRWLRRLADAGRPLPSLDGIAEATGILCRSDVTATLRDGERFGLIVVQYGRNGIRGIGAADGAWFVERGEEKVAQRRCLACRRVFQPDHRHNFLCGCNGESGSIAAHRRRRVAQGA
jgi:hypothetical protein